jgi:peptidoglycan/xylan/chitin deacetylase (PgdA/CDA1 family)
MRSAILTYHSIDDSTSVISLSPDVFRAQMEWLAAEQVRVLPLQQAWQVPGAVALTFDDGYRSFLDHALPVLDRLGFPATVFVVSGLCGGRNGWIPQGRGLPLLELMGWDDLRRLPATIEIGSHTVCHPDLVRLPVTEVDRELRQSRTEIEDRVGREVTSFAYPFGTVNPAVRAVASRHYRLACGTVLGFSGPEDDRWMLPRLDVYYLRSAFWFRRTWRSSGRAYLSFRALLRGWRR